MRKRRYFTQPEMEEVWDRWESGESLNSIARGLERGHSAVQGMLSSTINDQSRGKAQRWPAAVPCSEGGPSCLATSTSTQDL